MDAEKNVVEAARKLLKLIQPNAVGGFDVTGNLHDELRELMGAIAAYDSAPAPSEDRVREAVEAVEAASLRWVASVGRPDRGERNTRIADAMRPYVTPAPALPAGTVAVNVETLREGVAVLNRAYLGGINRGDDDVAKSHNALSKILPPPPRPEPPKELVAEWQAEGDALANGAGLAWSREVGIWRDAYVLGRRAAWEANGGA